MLSYYTLTHCTHQPKLIGCVQFTYGSTKSMFDLYSLYIRKDKVHFTRSNYHQIPYKS